MREHGKGNYDDLSLSLKRAKDFGRSISLRYAIKGERGCCLVDWCFE